MSKYIVQASSVCADQNEVAAMLIAMLLASTAAAYVLVM